MLGQISTAMAQAGLNIHNMVNKSRGDMAYTLVDVDSAVQPTVLVALRAIEGVLSVRYLPAAGESNVQSAYGYDPKGARHGATVAECGKSNTTQGGARCPRPDEGHEAQDRDRRREHRLAQGCPRRHLRACADASSWPTGFTNTDDAMRALRGRAPGDPYPEDAGRKKIDHGGGLFRCCSMSSPAISAFLKTPRRGAEPGAGGAATWSSAMPWSPRSQTMLDTRDAAMESLALMGIRYLRRPRRPRPCAPATCSGATVHARRAGASASVARLPDRRTRDDACNAPDHAR